jgi:hypothetical protein
VTVAHRRIPIDLAADLADSYMECEEVAAVRVEPELAQVVYRVDVPGGDLRQAARVGERVSEAFGLEFRIVRAELLKASAPLI